MAETLISTSSTVVATTEPERIFLVIVDASEELERALYFACRRARRVGGRVTLLYCMKEPESGHFLQFLGINERLEQETRETAEKLLYDLAEKTYQWSKKHAIVLVDEDMKTALPRLLEQEEISIIIQPMPVKGSVASSWASYLLEEGAAQMHIPLTMIPATMTIDEINKLT